MLAKNHTSVLTLPLDCVFPFPLSPFPVVHRKCMYTGQNLIQVKFFNRGWFSITFELGLGHNGN